MLRELDAVMLCQGHLPLRRNEVEQQLTSFAAAHGLTYLTPANPAETDLSHVGAGEQVLLRGSG